MSLDRSSPAADRLATYWTVGPGAAKIRWKTPGDFSRCVKHLTGKLRDPEGYCNELHQIAVGKPPGQGHGR